MVKRVVLYPSTLTCSTMPAQAPSSTWRHTTLAEAHNNSSNSNSHKEVQNGVLLYLPGFLTEIMVRPELRTVKQRLPPTISVDRGQTVTTRSRSSPPSTVAPVVGCQHLRHRRRSRTTKIVRIFRRASKIRKRSEENQFWSPRRWNRLLQAQPSCQQRQHREGFQ